MVKALPKGRRTSPLGLKELTPAQEKALPYFLTCKTHKDVSRATGVSTKQIFEWFKQSHFKKELAFQRRLILEGVRNTLIQASQQSVDVLVGLLKSEAENIRLKTAIGILDYTIRLTESLDMEDRVVALEESVNDQQKQNQAPRKIDFPQ